MKNSMDVIKVKYGNQETVSLTEFLQLEPEKLTEAERNIQESIQILYKMNGREPPLYSKFHQTHKNYPLTIDTTTCTRSVGAEASYTAITNEIKFKEMDQIHPLVVSLAHELKHAEQYSKELINRTCNDTYESIQLKYLAEAQAYAFDARIQSELFELPIHDPFGETVIYQEAFKKYEALPLSERLKKAEEDTILQLLPKLWNGSFYTVRYEFFHPVDLNDGSHVKKIPESFHLSDQILEKLKETPKAAQTPIGKVKQFIKTEDVENTLKILEQENIPTSAVQKGFSFILQKGSTQQLEKFFKIKNTEGNHLLSKDDQKEIIQKNLCFLKKDIDSKIDFLFPKNEERESFLSEMELRQSVRNCVVEGNKDVFDSLISRMTDSKGNLKLEKLNKNEKAISSFIFGWSLNNKKDSKSTEQRYQILKKLLQLKDKNGEKFITDVELAFELKLLFRSADIPSTHTLLKEITDQKGRLILSNKDFETVTFLDGIVEPNFGDFINENAKHDRYELLSKFKTLKDRDGNSIITGKACAHALYKLAIVDIDGFSAFSNFCTAISNKDLSLPYTQDELTEVKNCLRLKILSEETEEGIKRIPILFKLKDKNKAPLFSEKDLVALQDEMSQDPQRYKTIIPIVKEYQKKRHLSNFLGQMNKKVSSLSSLLNRNKKTNEGR